MKEPTAAGGDAAITAGGAGNGPHRAAAEAGEARREAAVAPPRARGGSGAERGGGSGAGSNTCPPLGEQRGRREVRLEMAVPGWQVTPFGPDARLRLFLVVICVG